MANRVPPWRRRHSRASAMTSSGPAKPDPARLRDPCRTTHRRCRIARRSLPAAAHRREGTARVGRRRDGSPPHDARAQAVWADQDLPKPELPANLTLQGTRATRAARGSAISSRPSRVRRPNGSPTGRPTRSMEAFEGTALVHLDVTGGVKRDRPPVGVVRHGSGRRSAVPWSRSRRRRQPAFREARPGGPRVPRRGRHPRPIGGDVGRWLGQHPGGCSISIPGQPSGAGATNPIDLRFV